MYSIEIVNLLRSWFRISGRRYYGGFAFVLQRITGLLMVVYFILHSVSFQYSLAIGYSFLPVIVAISVFHGINGCRLAINELGFGYQYRKSLFLFTLVLWLIVSTIFLLKLPW
jgi:succinate dehydrogenase/fumarate reductase cytochrome b subunit